MRLWPHAQCSRYNNGGLFNSVILITPKEMVAHLNVHIKCNTSHRNNHNNDTNSFERRNHIIIIYRITSKTCKIEEQYTICILECSIRIGYWDVINNPVTKPTGCTGIENIPPKHLLKNNIWQKSSCSCSCWSNVNYYGKLIN